MGDVVNLRLGRKRLARAERERQTAENRIRSGRPKSQRDVATREAERAAQQLEGHRRDRAPGDRDA